MHGLTITGTNLPGGNVAILSEVRGDLQVLVWHLAGGRNRVVLLHRPDRVGRPEFLPDPPACASGPHAPDGRGMVPEDLVDVVDTEQYAVVARIATESACGRVSSFFASP